MAHAEPALNSHAPAGDLGQLVAVEQDLEQRLAQAREQARELLEAAQRETETLRLSHERDLEELRTRIQTQQEAQQREKEAEIQADGRARAAAYDRLPDATVAELAGVGLELVLRGGAE
jgi:vacuolar-type H+-ATPase subunit H